MQPHPPLANRTSRERTPSSLATALLATLVIFLTHLSAPARAADDPAAAQQSAAQKSAAEMLPPTTLFYAELDHPADLIRLVLDHPLRQRLEQSPEYRKAFDTPQFKEFQTIVEAVENRSGVKWRQALETTTGGGFVVAVDAITQGLVVLSKSTDPKTTESVRDALFSLARDDARNKGNPDPIETKNYRGLTAYKAGESVIANVGPWLIVSNKPALSKAIADRILDGAAGNAADTLAQDEDFTAARKLEQDKPPADRGSAWAFLRLAPLRMVAASNPVFDKSAKSDNPAAELLIGGLAGAPRNAPYVSASLRLRDEGIKLTLTSPHDKSWIPAGREFFFAPAGQGGGADKPLKPKNTLLSITTYRDLAAWWAAGPDTYSEGVAAKMAQADSGLSNFLGGKSFGTDVLGAFAPQMQFVVAAQDYAAAGVPAPTIRLPAGAIVLRLRDSQSVKTDVKKHFRVAFQSIVALGNLDGASKGRPLLEMKTERKGGAEILYATYEAPSDDAPGAKPQAADKKPGAASDPKAPDTSAAEKDVYYNFSPALVMSKDRLMLCSTKQIADELVELASKESTPDRIAQNTLIEVSPQPIAELLRANRQQLIAQNMLEKGHDRAQAEKEIDVFVALVNALTGGRISLTPTDKTISLEIELKTSNGK